jgi:hypothetical protein
MTTSVGGKTVPGREKGGDDASWTDVNFTGPKKIHTIDSATTNER